jgi:hypothetical protein
VKEERAHQGRIKEGRARGSRETVWIIYRETRTARLMLATVKTDEQDCSASSLLLLVRHKENEDQEVRSHLVARGRGGATG